MEEFVVSASNDETNIHTIYMTVTVFSVVEVRRNYGSGHKTNKELDEMTKTNMDYLPKPSGAWEAGYKAKDSKANMALAFAGTCFVLTVVEVIVVG